MSGGSVIMGKQNRYMRRFREANATSAIGAKSLETIGCRPSWIFRSMVDQEVFVEVSAGHYYLDSDAAEAFLTRRRRKMLIAVAVIIVAMLVGFWIM